MNHQSADSAQKCRFFFLRIKKKNILLSVAVVCEFLDLNLCRLGKFSTFFLLSADFFQNQLFRKILSRIPSECQIVWIQIRPDILSGLIWVQTVCKGYQQTTLGGKESYMNLTLLLSLQCKRCVLTTVT